MGVEKIKIELEVPRKLISLTRDVRRVMNRTLARSGRKVESALRDTFRDYTVNTFGLMSKQVSKTKIKRFFTETYTDVEVVGSRQAVSAFLEYGTRPTSKKGVEWTELKKWFDKKGIARGRSPRERRTIFFAIWSKISREGISSKSYFAITRRIVETDITKLFEDELSKYIERMDDFDLSGEFDG